MTGALDTIFARASGTGAAAVTLVRLSGGESGRVLSALCGRLPRPRHASLRRLLAPGSGEVLDHALVLWFPGPASYTGESAAELHLHGGTAVWEAVSGALIRLGCRPAEPGEFTRRAFLHGKLDLTQCEAIADLIQAETEGQRRQALRQADGALSHLYGDWVARATRILAHQEAAIEFEMDDLPSDLDEKARLAAHALAAEMAAHLDDGGRGERMREGLSVAILGAPNAGKSSLLNLLLGRPAAIVSARPGTTRDVVESRLDLAGVPAFISDTAGLRSTTDEIEEEGVRRAEALGRNADIVMAVFAADRTPERETLDLLGQRADSLVVVNKSDLAPVPVELAGRRVLPVSARTGDGFAGLRAALAQEAQRLAGIGAAPVLTRARHRAAIAEAMAALAAAQQARLPELAAEDYRAALQALGRLTGRVEVEAILDSVFRDFCIGK
ncbi:tRNA uridine-5-carboxymethylaminomethyl(34) synthesis GTPase MnmE [Falsiroseomonas sp. CW058]|uniref:tRNA uridine-5-carboxymethylaminomethyl(34) synthesis GTPase MnmE n=1 Tax=Falsiroseomonas sp. CW058 TaxID=3388664 RepID=UPI003D317BAF